MDQTLEEAVAAFDDDALLKMMVAQVARTFPAFDGAPEPVKRARDGLVALVSAAPAMRQALRDFTRHVLERPKCQHHQGDAMPQTFESWAADLIVLAKDARELLGEG